MDRNEMKKIKSNNYSKPKLIKLGALNEKTKNPGGKGHSGSDSTSTTKTASKTW